MTHKFEFELSERETHRLQAATELVIARAAERGLTLTPEACSGLASVRLAVLGADSLNVEGALSEAKKLPEVAAQVNAATIAADLSDKESDLAKKMEHMSPSRRMTLGRELEAQATPPTPEAAQDEALLNLIMSIQDPQERLARARELGVA